MSLQRPEVHHDLADPSILGHEVILEFASDTTAERFADWIRAAGWEAFAAWHAQMEHDIEHHASS